MNDIYKFEKEIKNRVGLKRYEHILRVVSMAKELALIQNVNGEKAEVAAYFHDCAKCKNPSDIFLLAKEVDYIIPERYLPTPHIIHGHLGAHLARLRYGVWDKDILSAISYHTTGRAKMSKLEKLIYLADYLEEGRDFDQVDSLRQIARKDLDQAMYLSLKRSIEFLLENKQKIAMDTIDAWNERN